MAMASDDNIRCAQCTFVVLNIFPEMLQDLLADTNVPPSTLYRMIQRSSKIRLNKFEWRTVNTMKTNGFTKLDVSLMYKIIKFFNLIDPPTRNWGANPLPNEHELGDDIERIRKARNHLVHKCDANVSEQSFTEFFDNSSNVSRRLDKYLKKTEISSYEKRIQQYKSCLLDKVTIEKLLEDRYKEEKLKEISTFSLDSHETEVHVMTGKSMKDVFESVKSIAGDSVSPIKIIIYGIEVSEDNVDVINSFKNDLQTDSITFKNAEKSCLILFADIKNKTLQDDTLFVQEVNWLIRNVFRLCKIQRKPDKQINAVVTSAEEEFDRDHLDEKEEGGPNLFGNEDNLVLHVEIQNKALLSNETMGHVCTKFLDTVIKTGNGKQFIGKKSVHAVLVPEEEGYNQRALEEDNRGRLEERLEDHLRANRKFIEKELYPKDYIDNFLEWFILSIEDHEALRSKENVRQHMAHSFLEKIMKPTSIEKGSMSCLLKSFQTDQNCILKHLSKLMDSELQNGISHIIDDAHLQDLLKMRDDCRNSILREWRFLNENFYPCNILIDELYHSGLVDEDRAESIKGKPRHEQVYLTLRNIIRRIDRPEMFSKLISILKRKDNFIVEKLEKRLNEKGVTTAIQYDFRQLSGTDVNDARAKLEFFKDDIVKEVRLIDVDIFVESLVFNVDDHEIIYETGNGKNEKALCFYEKIFDKEYIARGSFDCLVFCLMHKGKWNTYRQKLAKVLLSQPIQIQDAFIYARLKLTVRGVETKNTLEDEIFEVGNSSELKEKDVDGQENIKFSDARSEEGKVFEGKYEVSITKEGVQSPLQSMSRLEQTKKKGKELNEQVEFWKNFRRVTLPRIDELIDELKHANIRIRYARTARNQIVSVTLAAGFLFSLYTAGVSMALGAAAVTVGAVGVTLLVEKYVEKSVLDKSQEDINKDKEATLRLIKRIRAYTETESIPFAENLLSVRLYRIEDLARDPLTIFISSLVGTESASLMSAIERLTELREQLEKELQEVERLQEMHDMQ